VAVDQEGVIASVLRPSPVRTAVSSAPFQSGDVVRVTGSCDEVGDESTLRSPAAVVGAGEAVGSGGSRCT
jgi:hypothetical protein